MIIIDGSLKSGSGTIVRDAIPFAILKRKPIRLFNIRAKREKPGLRAQHLKAMEACARISSGHLNGAAVGSMEITFFPGKGIQGGFFQWDIGTAGSTTMLALAILPLMLFADKPSQIKITGGLFQDFAPSVFHLNHVLLPLLHKMGAKVELKIIQPGYVPRGQGQIELNITPVAQPLKPISLLEQGEVRSIKGIALSSHLQGKKVSERMADECIRVLKSRGYEAEISVLYDTRNSPAYKRPAVQPGAALAIWAETSTGCRLGADMAGALGRPAEFIGRQTAKNLLEDLNTGATVDRYLADQLIPYAALAQGQSQFYIPYMTDHVEARLWLVEEILGAKTKIEDNRIQISGIGYLP